MKDAREIDKRQKLSIGVPSLLPDIVTENCFPHKPFNMKQLLVAAALAQAVTIADATVVELDKRLDNGLGLTPPMGWSSWVSWRL